jgi:hypothetical protein
VTTTPGIDVSHWQTRTPPLGGVSFLIARATVGTGPDERYALHIGNARKAGIVTGAYHFNWSTLTIASQVKAFIATAGDVDLYALDVERDAGSGTPRFSPAEARDFIARFHDATGKRIGLYMSESDFYRDVGQDWNWVANWSRRPSIPWKLWQYGKSTLHTPPPTIDGDVFNGTIAELRTFAGVAMPLVVTSTATKIVALTIGDQIFNPDGSPLVKMSVATKRASPYGVKIGTVAYRVLHVTTGGSVKLALVRNADVTLTDPAPDATPYNEADVKARVASATAVLEARIGTKTTALRVIEADAREAAAA